MIEITLKKDHPIRGQAAKKGSTHEVHKGVADDLIARGIAEILAKDEAAKK